MALKITFVIPALNEEALIARCIRSIRSEAPGSPIIVVDNGSSDRTVENAMSFPGVIVIHEDKRGINQARKRGLEAAITEWVAFIDADNELPDGWLLVAWQAVKSGPDIVAVSGPPVYVELSAFTRVLIFLFYCVGRVIHNIAPMVQGGGFIVDRQAFIKAGGFDLDIEFYGEDTATARRLSKVGKVKFDLGLYFNSSARRLVAEGVFYSGTKYALNYAWMWLAGRPLTRTHSDHREAA